MRNVQFVMESQTKLNAMPPRDVTSPAERARTSTLHTVQRRRQLKLAEKILMTTATSPAGNVRHATQDLFLTLQLITSLFPWMDVTASQKAIPVSHIINKAIMRPVGSTASSFTRQMAIGVAISWRIQVKLRTYTIML